MMIDIGMKYGAPRMLKKKQMMIDIGKVGPLLSSLHPSLAAEHQAGETVGMAGTHLFFPQ